MTKSKKKLTFTFERTIPAPQGTVYSAWLNPKRPGNPWHEGDKLIFNPKVDGFFYWFIQGIPHYGRFTKVERPSRIQHTIMSPYTFGQESIVTVTFKKKGAGTLMTLTHSELPDHKLVKSHNDGWNYFLDLFTKQFGNSSRRKK